MRTHKPYLLTILYMLILCEFSLATIPTFPEPELWYTFESVGDTVYDQSGNQHHGIINGLATRQPGTITFSNNDLIKIGPHSGLDGVSGITAAFRVALTNTTIPNYMYLIRNFTLWEHVNYALYYHPDNKYFGVHKEETAYNQVFYRVLDNEFHEIVLVVDGNLAFLYFDGELLEGNIQVGAREIANDSVFIAENFTGIFDEVKVFAEALNDKQVKTVFTSDVVPPTAPQNLTIQNSTNYTTELIWKPAFDSIGVAGYYIYRDSVLIGSTENTFYSDSSHFTDTSYSYSVKAVDYSGNLSPSSNSVVSLLCREIEFEYLETKYKVLWGDTLTIETDVEDNGYTFYWQSKEDSTWYNLSPKVYYSNVGKAELIINGIHRDSIPKFYRINIENNCGTYAFGSVEIELGTTHSITGKVVAGKGLLERGMVYLYESTDSIEPVPLDSTEVSYGSFGFSHLRSGTYILKGKPIGEAAELYAETFYRSGNNFSEAYVLNLDYDISDVTISLGPKYYLSVGDLNTDMAVWYNNQNKEISISFQEGYYGQFTFCLVDQLGRVVHKDDLFITNSTVSIDVAEITPGTYFLVLQTEKGRLCTQQLLIK